MSVVSVVVATGGGAFLSRNSTSSCVNERASERATVRDAHDDSRLKQLRARKSMVASIEETGVWVGVGE